MKTRAMSVGARLIAAFSLVAGLTPVILFAAESPAGATVASVATEAELDAAFTALSGDNTGPHVVTITADITYTDASEPTYTGTQDLTINGNGFTLDAAGLSRGITFESDANLVINDLTIHDGATATGAGLFADGTGSVTINRSTFSANTASNIGGGAALLVTTFSISDSTFTGNSAAGWGAAVTDNGSPGFGNPATITNSTFVNNTDLAAGGGTVNFHQHVVTMTHVTIDSNTTSDASAGQLYLPEGLTAQGLVVSNVVGPGTNCFITTVDASSYSYDTDGSCGFAGTGDTSAGADPGFETLGFRAGPTQTQPPVFGSPLVDAIPAGSCPLATDQRGVPRPVGIGCDIGAVERMLSPAAVDSEIELRAAFSDLSTDPAATDVIEVGGDITLTSPWFTGTPEAYAGPALQLEGNGFTLDGGGASSVLVSDAGTLVVNDAIVQNAAGPGIFSAGPLEVNRSIIRNNVSTGNGGGIFGGSSVVVDTSTISGNHADIRGGGIYGDGTATITVTSSTMSGNSASSGGAIWLNAGTITADNSTVAENVSDSSPTGAIDSCGTVSLAHATVFGNTGASAAQVYDECGGTLLADSSVVSATTPACQGFGSVTRAYTLVSDATCGAVGTGGSNTALPASLLLEPLGNHGGPTEVLFPGPGSPMRDAVPNGSCLGGDFLFDQRGSARPGTAGSACDIGSVEVNGVLGAATGVTLSPAQVLETTGPVSMKGTFDDTATGGQTIASAQVTVNGKALFSKAAAATADDGAFDEPVEAVTASVDVSALPPGDHLLCLSGTDSDGATSTPVCKTLTVTDDPACPSPAPNAFTDDEGNTHEANINCIAFWKITGGKGGGIYDPLGNVTRAQMATFIANLMTTAGYTFPASPPDAFTDDNDNTHQGNINKLAAAGVSGGKGNGLYDPDGLVTRAQMATFIANAIKVVSGTPLPAGGNAFTDDEGNTHEANINALAAASIVGGKGGGLYDPSGFVTRAQMGTFIANAARNLDTSGFWPNLPS